MKTAILLVAFATISTVIIWIKSLFNVDC